MFLQTRAIWGSFLNCSFRNSFMNFLAQEHAAFTSFKLISFCEFAILGKKKKITRGKI